MRTKPEKPSPDFPLFPHAGGKWAKKIRGKLYYFGHWEDPAAAIREYEERMTAQVRPPVFVGLTVRDACNGFLNAKQGAVDRRELAPRSFTEYRSTCSRLAGILGRDSIVEQLTPADFARYRAERAKRWNLVAVGNEVTRVRSLFKWCHEARLISEPVHFGPDFKRPSAKAMRRHRRLAGKKMFEPDQIRRILDYAGIQMRAMIYLGINCGFGPTDCAELPLCAVDLDRAWISYPRPKTEVEREIPLWPETAEALRAVLSRRYAAQAGAEERLFLQSDGQPWDTSTNPIAKHFRQTYTWSGLRRGGFYWLRHTFATVAGDSKDQVAVNAIMGHVDGSVAAVYRQAIWPSRLLAVVNHVRAWVYSVGSTMKKSA